MFNNNKHVVKPKAWVEVYFSSSSALAIAKKKKKKGKKEFNIRI